MNEHLFSILFTKDEEENKIHNEILYLFVTSVAQIIGVKVT